MSSVGSVGSARYGAASSEGGEGGAGGAAGGGADVVSGVINAVSTAVSVTAGVAAMAIAQQASPSVTIHNIAAFWPKAMKGLVRTRQEYWDLKAKRDGKQRWLDEHPNHIGRPAVRNEIAVLESRMENILRKRGPTLSNIKAMMDNSGTALKGNVVDYRTMAQALWGAWAGIDLMRPLLAVQAVYPPMAPTNLMEKGTLKALWPSDPDAAVGRVPPQARDTFLNLFLSMQASGLVAQDAVIPGWALGFKPGEVPAYQLPTVPQLRAIQARYGTGAAAFSSWIQQLVRNGQVDQAAAGLVAPPAPLVEAGAAGGVGSPAMLAATVPPPPLTDEELAGPPPPPAWRRYALAAGAGLAVASAGWVGYRLAR